MIERWKKVVGNSAYSVSDLGRVRCDADRRILGSGRARNTYPQVWLLDSAGRKKLHAVHALVLEAFIGPCPAGMEARHWPDRSRRNIRLDNLSWSDHETNCRDQLEHGTASRKLLPEDAARIRDLRMCGATQQECADHFLISRPMVSYIERGMRWRTI